MGAGETKDSNPCVAHSESSNKRLVFPVRQRLLRRKREIELQGQALAPSGLACRGLSGVNPTSILSRPRQGAFSAPFALIPATSQANLTGAAAAAATGSRPSPSSSSSTSSSGRLRCDPLDTGVVLFDRVLRAREARLFPAATVCKQTHASKRGGHKNWSARLPWLPGAGATPAGTWRLERGLPLVLRIAAINLFQMGAPWQRSLAPARGRRRQRRRPCPSSQQDINRTSTPRPGTKFRSHHRNKPSHPHTCVQRHKRAAGAGAWRPGQHTFIPSRECTSSLAFGSRG